MVSWIVLLGLVVVAAGIAAVFFFWKGEWRGRKISIKTPEGLFTAFFSKRGLSGAGISRPTRQGAVLRSKRRFRLAWTAPLAEAHRPGPRASAAGPAPEGIATAGLVRLQRVGL